MRYNTYYNNRLPGGNPEERWIVLNMNNRSQRDGFFGSVKVKTSDGDNDENQVLIQFESEKGKKLQMVMDRKTATIFSEVLQKGMEKADMWQAKEDEQEQKPILTQQMTKHLTKLCTEAINSEYNVLVGEESKIHVSKEYRFEGWEKSMPYFRGFPGNKTISLFCADCETKFTISEGLSRSGYLIYKKHLDHEIIVAPKCDTVYEGGQNVGARCGAYAPNAIIHDERKFYCGKHIKAARRDTPVAQPVEEEKNETIQTMVQETSE